MYVANYSLTHIVCEPYLLREALRFVEVVKGGWDMHNDLWTAIPQRAGELDQAISALIEDRDPYPNAVQSANWTCVGICAHESALKGGEIVRLPEFTLS